MWEKVDRKKHRVGSQQQEDPADTASKRVTHKGKEQTLS